MFELVGNFWQALLITLNIDFATYREMWHNDTMAFPRDGASNGTLKISPHVCFRYRQFYFEWQTDVIDELLNFIK